MTVLTQRISYYTIHQVLYMQDFIYRRINVIFLDTMKVYGEMEVDPVLISISTILG